MCQLFTSGVLEWLVRVWTWLLTARYALVQSICLAVMLRSIPLRITALCIALHVIGDIGQLAAALAQRNVVK